MSLRRIIKDQRILADDCQHISDDDALPAGNFTVSLARWNKEREMLSKERAADVGVRIPNDMDVNEIVDQINSLPRIVVVFPKFSDGRAMSQARVLRQQHGYQGEIRATGDVQRDQIWHMYRCGIDAFEPRPDRPIEDALKAFTEMSVAYQPAVDSDTSIFQRRRIPG